jgi:hypothetical protein
MLLRSVYSFENIIAFLHPLTRFKGGSKEGVGSFALGIDGLPPVLITLLRTRAEEKNVDIDVNVGIRLTLTICHTRARFLKVEIHHPENSLYAHTLYLGGR